MTDNPSAEAQVAVVDDEPEIGDIIRRTLHNYEVELHESAAEIFEALADGRRYEVILCDLYMPEVSGRQVYDELLERWPSQAKRLVFMSGISASVARQDILEGLSAPMLEKPFRLNDLREAVAEVADME